MQFRARLLQVRRFSFQIWQNDSAAGVGVCQRQCKRAPTSILHCSIFVFTFYVLHSRLKYLMSRETDPNWKWTQDLRLSWCILLKDSPEEYKTKLRTLGQAVKADSNAYVEEITVDTAAKTIQRVVYVNGEQKKDSGVVSTGVEVDHPSGDGRPAKVIHLVHCEHIAGMLAVITKQANYCVNVICQLTFWSHSAAFMNNFINVLVGQLFDCISVWLIQQECQRYDHHR